jgi:hypothetical protein
MLLSVGSAETLALGSLGNANALTGPKLPGSKKRLQGRGGRAADHRMAMRTSASACYATGLAEQRFDQRAFRQVAIPALGHHLFEHALHPPQVCDFGSHVLKVGRGDNARFCTLSIALVDQSQEHPDFVQRETQFARPQDEA